MTQHLTQTRRTILLNAALMGLSACGGGGGAGTGGTGSPLLLPGTGGTGAVSPSSPIIAAGPISGFGSVIVNGVRFDDTQATVSLDGQAATVAQLGLGMTAVVTGNTTSIGATQASAAAIETWAIAQGSVSASTAGSLTLAGIPIALDSATVFSGLAGASAVALGATLKVWAVNTDGAFSTWLATRVEAVVPTLTPTLITSGVVKQVSGNLTLNGYGLSGSRIVGLVAGLAVTVSGNLVGGALAVTSVHLLNSLPVIASGTVMEREGTVTALTSAGQFQMGVYPVDASAATVTPSTGVPALGSRVEVQGIWDGKTLVARAVEIKTQQRLQEVEVEASITQFTSVSDFVVRGLHCDASALTKIEGGSLADLKVGVKVHVHGLNMGSSVRLTELEIVK